MILSGFIFPIPSMPGGPGHYAHALARIPVALRGSIVLKGADITAFWQDMVALVIFATVALGLAAIRLRREWS